MANCCTTEVKLAICCSSETEEEISLTFLTGSLARVLNCQEFATMFEINILACWGIFVTSPDPTDVRTDNRVVAQRDPKTLIAENAKNLKLFKVLKTY